MAEIALGVVTGAKIIKEGVEAIDKGAWFIDKVMTNRVKVTIIIKNFFGQAIDVQLSACKGMDWTTIQVECF